MINKSRELVILRPTIEYLKSRYGILIDLLASKSIPHFPLPSFEKFLKENLPSLSESEASEDEKIKFVLKGFPTKS